VPDPKSPSPTIRPFADFLREQAKGHSHEELSEGLRDLVGRVQDTGKKGSITYTVFVEPTKGMTDALTVSDQIKLKLPEHDRDASLFFSDADGNLTRSDPNQMVFESLREVPPPGVNAKTGEATADYKGA
jgi:hypothetical protein